MSSPALRVSYISKCEVTCLIHLIADSAIVLQAFGSEKALSPEQFIPESRKGKHILALIRLLSRYGDTVISMVLAWNGLIKFYEVPTYISVFSEKVLSAALTAYVISKEDRRVMYKWWLDEKVWGWRKYSSVPKGVQEIFRWNKSFFPFLFTSLSPSLSLPPCLSFSLYCL